MSKHEDIYLAAEAAIQRVFDDTSVPQDETKESLVSLRSKIDELLEALD